MTFLVWMDYQQIVDKGGNTNETVCQVVTEESTAWILSGSSGFSEKKLFTDAPSDGRWFVNRINSYILQKMSSSVSMTNMIRYAIRETTLDAVDEMSFSGHPEMHTFDKISETLTPTDLPFATISMADWSNGTVDVLSLGDSGIATMGENNSSYVTQGDPKQYYKSQEQSDENIEKTRRRQQIPGGYWVVGFNPVAVDFAVQETYYSSDIRNILISTGRVATIVDKYPMYDNWSDVIRHINRTSPRTLANELREYGDENIENRRDKDIGLIHIRE